MSSYENKDNPSTCVSDGLEDGCVKDNTNITDSSDYIWSSDHGECVHDQTSGTTSTDCNCLDTSNPRKEDHISVNCQCWNCSSNGQLLCPCSALLPSKGDDEVKDAMETQILPTCENHCIAYCMYPCNVDVGPLLDCTPLQELVGNPTRPCSYSHHEYDETLPETDRKCVSANELYNQNMMHDWFQSNKLGTCEGNDDVVMCTGSCCVHPHVNNRSLMKAIGCAIMSQPGQRITLEEIYRQMTESGSKVTGHQKWQKKIKMFLARNECFIKLGIARGRKGRPHFWAVHPACSTLFSVGNFCLRESRLRVREHVNPCFGWNEFIKEKVKEEKSRNKKLKCY